MKLLRLSLRATPSSTCLKTACLLLPAIVLAVGVRAQPANYPHKAVRIISDAAPGGAIDTNLRIIAESLSQKWAQQVVIENRPGAGGSISATVAAEAPPDGYTMYAPALSVFLTIPGKAPNLPLKLPRDFTPIGITAVQPQSIGINPKLSINSLPELIAQAKKEPGSISYAVTGVGRLTHLTGELLQIRANIQLQMVPYTGGSAQALADVTAGRVSLVIEGYAGLAGAYEFRPTQSVGSRLGKASASPSRCADRCGNAAWFCRRRLAMRGSTGRNARRDRAQDQRRSARGANQPGNQGQAGGTWCLRASDNPDRGPVICAKPARAVEARAGTHSHAVQRKVARPGLIGSLANSQNPQLPAKYADVWCPQNPRCA